MLQTASLSGVLKTLLIIVLVYYGFKLLMRILAPWLLKYAAQKMEKKFGDAFQQTRQPSSEAKQEGETVIDSMPDKEPKSNKKVGEYIDFEEID